MKMTRCMGMAALALAIVCTHASAQGYKVGGLSFARSGSVGNITTGSGWAAWRADFGTIFEQASYASTPTLTDAFLSDIDLLLLTAVAENNNIETVPLSAAEQAAVVAYINAGGRAVIVSDNDTGYTNASWSLLSPFGLAPGGTLPNSRYADMNLSAPPCTVGLGPFGAMASLQGNWPGWFASTGSAYAMGRWRDNFMPAIASLQQGSGRVMFVSDGAMLDTPFLPGVQTNEARRNTILWMGARTRTVPESVSVCIGHSVELGTTFPAKDTTTYQWYHDGNLIPGATGPTLTVMGGAGSDGLYHCQITYADLIACPSVETVPASVGYCGSDFDCSGFTDLDDFTAFVLAFEAGTDDADFDGSGFVDLDDFTAFVLAFESGC